jgi:hypothetical protein
MQLSSTLNRLLILFLASALFFTSCITIQPNGPGNYPDERKEKDKDEGREHDGQVYSFSALGIPKGHLPPPGECKIWIPGSPAGQQGPPQSCGSAFQNAPLGAWVITHTGDRYKVNVLSKVKPRIVVDVRFYALR